MLAVTLTNLGNFAQFLAWIILTFRVTEKLQKCHQYLHDNDYVIVTHWKMPFMQEEREFRLHSATIVAFKFAGFKSSWLQCVMASHEKVYKRRATDLDDLKHHIRTEWTELDHVHQWRRRLSACVKAGGSQLEHSFWFRHCVFSNNCDLSCCRWPVEQLHANRPVWFNCNCQVL